jgi:hypothetical protein
MCDPSTRRYCQPCRPDFPKPLCRLKREEEVHLGAGPGLEAQMHESYSVKPGAEPYDTSASVSTHHAAEENGAEQAEAPPA